MVQISTAFMFFFSIFGLFRPTILKCTKDIPCIYLIVFDNVNLCLSGKFGAFFASIPLPIFAAIYCVLFGIVGE